MKGRVTGVFVILIAALIVFIPLGCSKKPSAEQMLLEGKEFFKQGNFQKALESFNKAADAAPDNGEAHFYKANTLSQLGKKAEAIAEYDKAIQLAPGVPQPYFNRGNAYANIGKNQEAVESFDQAIQKDPTYAKAYYNKGLVLERMGMTKEAQDAFAKAKAIAPALNPPSSAPSAKAR